MVDYKINFTPGPRHIVLIAAVLYLVKTQSQQGQVHRRFEYKHSFRRPNLAQRDGSVVFWQVSGGKFSVFFH